MRRLLAILAAAGLPLLALGCATPKGAWRVTGPATSEQAVQALDLAEAARRLLPDRKGWLAMGGELHLALGPYALDGVCLVAEGYHAAGCAAPGLVEVLVWPEGGFGPDLATTALAHELCHLGLERGGGCPTCGPVRGATEAEADACALLVVQEHRRSAP